MTFNGKTAIVTGASKGLGRATALAFSGAGAHVVANYFTSGEAIRELAETNLRILPLRADVSDINAVEEMVKLTVKELGSVDILVNNAAIYLDSVVWKMTEDTWDKVLDVNLKGVFNCTKAVIPYMRERGWGRIINITSVVGQTGGFGVSNYGASKAGVIGFTKAVAREVAKFNITVNALSLGYIDAGMNLRLPETTRAEILRTIPLGRWGKESEVTDTVLFLASEGAGYITGQVINVNGGCYM
jgi:3-oxoacyl-[acyl-carrier protein] reductase